MKTKITITPAHAEKAGVYSDNHSCLLATALRSHFPKANVFVTPECFSLNGVDFEYSARVEKKIHKAYNSHRYDRPVVSKSFSFTVDIPKAMLTIIK